MAINNSMHRSDLTI